MFRACSFFMIVLTMFGSVSAPAASIQHFSSGQIAEMVMDKASNGFEVTGLAMFKMYFDSELQLQERVSVVRHLVNDSGWKALSAEGQLTVLKSLLEEGPLSVPIERELLYLIAQLGTVEAIKYLKTYLRVESNVTFYDDDYFPSLIAPWRRWLLTRRLDGQILKGEGVVRPEELTLLASLWASSVQGCEVRLGPPSVR